MGPACQGCGRHLGPNDKMFQQAVGWAEVSGGKPKKSLRAIQYGSALVGACCIDAMERSGSHFEQLSLDVGS